MLGPISLAIAVTFGVIAGIFVVLGAFIAMILAVVFGMLKLFF